MDHRAAEDRRDAAAGCSLRQSDPGGASATCGEHAASDAAAKAQATEALHKRLLARQSYLQILGNTNRLLRQRGHLAQAALQQARARNAACAPAAEPPPPLDCGLVSPEAGQLTARAQRRMFAPSAESPAPGLARFRAHCGINTDALIRMQGSTGSIDVSEKNLRVLIDDYRSRTAVSASMHEDQICWHLVTTWEMALGMPLSFGLALTTAACTASFLVTFFLCQVECALLLEEKAIHDVTDMPESPGADDAAPDGGPQAATDGRHPGEHRSAQRGAPQPHSRAKRAPPGSVGDHDTIPVEGHAASLRLPLTATRPRRDGPADVLDSSEAHPVKFVEESTMRGTHNQPRHWPPAYEPSMGHPPESPEGLDESRGSHSGWQGSVDCVDGPLGLWRGGTVHDADPSAEPQLRCGVGDALPLAPTVHSAMEALVRRFTQRLPQRRVLAVLGLMLRTFAEEPSAGSADGAEDEAPAGDAAAGKAFHMHHWQGALGAMQATQGALSAIHDRLAQEGVRPWQVSPSEHTRDMQRLERRLQDFTLGTVGIMACCAHVFLAFSLKFAFPGEFCEVENMQVRLYKLLRLPQSQKVLMAAVWKDWDRNRCMLSLNLTEAQLPISVWSPHAGDMPPFAALAAAVAAGGSTFRLRTLPERSRVPDMRPCGFFASVLHGCGGADTPSTLPQRRFTAGDGRLLLDSPSAWVTSRELAAAAPGMLGQCPVATIAAAETLRRLRDMQSGSLRLYEDLVSRFTPGGALTGPQAMQMFWLHVKHGVGCADLLGLCHLAHRQVRREEMFATVDAIAL